MAPVHVWTVHSTGRSIHLLHAQLFNSSSEEKAWSMPEVRFGLQATGFIVPLKNILRATATALPKDQFTHVV